MQLCKSNNMTRSHTFSVRVDDFKEKEQACIILSLTVDHSDNPGFCG